MPSRLAELLAAARHRHFVGRADEQRLFSSAIGAAELPFHVLFVHGPGGVGKTTLLAEFARACAVAGVRWVVIDGRAVEPSPRAFLQTIRQAMGLDEAASAAEALGALRGRAVLFVDTYERLASLDGWIRDEFLPQLPEQVLVVLAGRDGPAAAWLVDSGWQCLLRRLPLDNLSTDESRAYLALRGVPDQQHDAALEFTRGYPLALSLVADLFAQRPNARFQPSENPDVVRTLLDQLVQQVPGPAHRAALEACALLRLTTETLLAQMLAMPDVHELFRWLSGLSFIQFGRAGLFPHDLARQALTADLRWRNPDWYAELHRRARAYYADRLLHTQGLEQQRVLFDYFFLHRDNPVVRPFFEWQESGSALPDHLAPDDVPALLAMVERHEGGASAELARHWLARQPEGVLVYRGADLRPAGFLARVALHRADPADIDADPATRAASLYLQRHAPLRPGEGAIVLRFWMADDTYQAVSAVQTLVFGSAAQYYLTTPDLAFSFFPCADADFWSAALGYVDFARLSEADFEVGGRRYGVFGHDWRAVPPTAWLDLLAEREIATAVPPPSSAPQSPAATVLSEAEFATAVHEALRSLRRGEGLRANPLLRSRIVLARTGANAGAAARAAALQALIKEAGEELRTSSRDAKAYRALHQTYFRPAATQELAAEALGWPFSTFRRHLKAGTDRLTDLLWQMEIERTLD